MEKILYLTDFYFNAQGRNYYKEDLFITEALKDHFNILIANPKQVMAYLDTSELIVFRNTGPVMNYLEYFKEFQKTVLSKRLNIYNSFDGKGDMQGKQYLLNLSKSEYPVIPTINQLNDFSKIDGHERYVIKPIVGADSIGMQVLDKNLLFEVELGGFLVQPYLNFEYEISFYFIDGEFQYALYAPEKKKRWELIEIEPSTEDLQFAYQFIEWNQMKHGIQRVDACRIENGELLLVELEDLNPFLSLDCAKKHSRSKFMKNFVKAISKAVG